MNTLEAIAKRVSVRSYKSEQISEEALEKILKAGMAAPVGRGRYDNLHITVVQNRELLDKIGNGFSELFSKMFNQKVDKNFGAPTMIFVSEKDGMDNANAACVLENMIIAATSMEIDNILWAGGCMVVKQDDELRNALGIPEEYIPSLCASFGYAKEPEEAKVHTITVNRV